jgi:uncharacterized protein involved in exopolysaccharide biosynthesis
MSVPDISRLKRYLAVILRWFAITAVVFVLTLLSGYYITENLLSKVYTATAQIQIIPRGHVIVPGIDSNPQSYDSTFHVEIETMQSPEFLLPIIYDLGLDKAWAKRVDQPGLDALPSQDALLPQDALAYKILKIKLQRETNTINITISSDEPTEAARIANAVADRYKILRNTAAHQTSLEGVSQESPVRIISRAEPPTEPSKPNKNFDFIVTMVVAGFLSLAVASFVEIILLFLRASERTDN